MIRAPSATKEEPMPTRIVFVAPGVRGGVLTQVFVEEPDQVFETLSGSGGLPFRLTARTSREEAVFVNPSTIAYWTAFSPSRARTSDKRLDANDAAGAVSAHAQEASNELGLVEEPESDQH
jgi:hypothetical protein